MNSNYQALRLISKLNTIVGWISIAIGVIVAIIAFASGQIGPGLLSLIGATFVGLVLIASGEIIILLIDIEDNTRKSRQQNTYSAPIAQPHIDYGRAPEKNTSANMAQPQNHESGSRNHTEVVAENIDRSKSDFEEQRLAALSKISKLGYIVESYGEYPSIEWIIRKDFKQIKRIKSLDELLEFASAL
jgi:hypothetical protein